MAKNNVSLKLTNYGLNKVMGSGANTTFKYFSLSDMNEIYYIDQKPNLSDIMNITGSKNLFTARKSCNDAVPTVAQVSPPTNEEVLRTEERWVTNFYKTNCETGDYDKTNLDLTINLHEYFSWLETVSGESGYTESLQTSLKLIEGVYLIKQKQNFVDKTWSNVDTTNRFVTSYEFLTEEDKNNYLKFNSKYIISEGNKLKQVDKSFDRFYSTLLLGFGNNVEGGRYLEGHNSYVTFAPPQFGYVVNGTTNFITLGDMKSTDSYKEIRPAVILGKNNNDLYYLKEPSSFKTTDINGFMGQAIWGYCNNKGLPLINGLINKTKNHIEFYFKETSFNKWESNINLKMVFGGNNDVDIIGGNIRYNFVYDKTATIIGYDNIIVIN